MPHAIPYVSFNGNCAEAMRFYERALGGKLQKMLKGSDTPWADQMPPEMGSRIMHAALELPGGGLLYAGDCAPDMPYEGINGISIALAYDTVAEGDRVFNALLEGGGKVTMPLAATFWAKSFGMLVDRYGVAWMVNGEFIPF